MSASYITDFIQGMNAEEVKISKAYIHGNNKELNDKKVKTLFNILIQDPHRQFSEKELEIILNSKSNAVRVLKSRLFDRVIEALTSNKHFENDKLFNERETILFTLKKKMLLAKSLYRKLNDKKTKALDALLEEIINYSKSYECFDVLAEALSLKKYYRGFKLGLTGFEKMTQEIHFYENCYKAIQSANDTYCNFVLNQDFVSDLKKKKSETYLIDAIQKLDRDYSKTNAQEVNYYSYQMKLRLYEHQKDYLNAALITQKLLKTIKHNKVLYTIERHSYALNILSQIKIYLGQFNEATTYSKNSQKLIIKNSIDYVMSLEIEFYTYWYAGKYTEANKGIDELLNISILTMGVFRKAKYTYYKACILFAMKKYKDTLELLSKPLEIEKDKTGWNIGLRVQLIMTYTELNKFSESSRAISAIRKYIERNNIKNQISQRDILIFKLLRELEKDDFKRNPGNKTTIQLLRGLSDKDKPTAWNYFTPEMIPFHEWVMTLPVKN